MLHQPRIRKGGCIASAVLSLAILIVLTSRALADVGAPDTPAGHTLQAFLEAVNSADSDRITVYVKQYDPHWTAEQLTAFSGQTGGLTLTSIAGSSPDRISFVVRTRRENLDEVGILQLESTSPPRVRRLNFRLIPLGERADDIQLDATQRQTTVDAIAKQLTAFYVYPDVATKMIRALRDHQKRGDYNSLVDGDEFASDLTRDLHAINNDGHLSVRYQPFISAKQSDSSADALQPNPAEQARMRAMLERRNCTFSKLEILNHNIGYIKFDEFPSPEVCAPTVVAAMNFVAHTDALIFDLRENHGGHPEMVDFMVSYLFSETTHINDLFDRHDNETRQFWTLPWVPGARFVDQPVYVLTSHVTFSGAEEFVFDLQTQKRATIVGETTGGGAHPTRGLPAGDHFTIGVPFARPINPVTKGDWEGKGVVPDVQANAADALATAEKLAAEKLAAKDGHK